MKMPLQLTSPIRIIFISALMEKDIWPAIACLPLLQRKTPGSFLPGVFVSESRNLRRW